MQACICSVFLTKRSSTENAWRNFSQVALSQTNTHIRTHIYIHLICIYLMWYIYIWIALKIMLKIIIVVVRKSFLVAFEFENECYGIVRWKLIKSGFSIMYFIFIRKLIAMNAGQSVRIQLRFGESSCFHSPKFPELARHAIKPELPTLFPWSTLNRTRQGFWK